MLASLAFSFACLNRETVNILFLFFFLRLTERSSYRVMEGEYQIFLYVSGDTNLSLPPKEKKIPQGQMTSSPCSSMCFLSSVSYALSFKCVPDKLFI